MSNHGSKVTHRCLRRRPHVYRAQPPKATGGQVAKGSFAARAQSAAARNASGGKGGTSIGAAEQPTSRRGLLSGSNVR